MDKNCDFIFKISLLGDTFTGKTALLLRYVDNSFDFSNHYATIGIDNREKLIVFDMYKIKYYKYGILQELKDLELS